MNNYEVLDFSKIRCLIAEQACFEKSQLLIKAANLINNPIKLNQELILNKEVLKLYREYGTVNFLNLVDVDKLLKHIQKKGVVTPMDIIHILEWLESKALIDKYVQNVQLKVPAFQNLVSALSNYTNLIKQIKQVITKDGEIKKDASETLVKLYQKQDELQFLINDKIQMLIQKYHDSLMDNISVKRNGRTCLLVKVSDKNKIKGMVHDLSSSGQAAYVEPASLINLNNEQQVINQQINQEEERLILLLVDAIKKDVDKILADVETITLIDSYFAKAKWCQRVDGCYPVLTDEKNIILKGVAHPLIDQEKVVRNDYEIISPCNTLVISGSNTGGKTVTLKNIGLMCLLGLSGLPLSCYEAQIYAFENLYLDIGDGQSVIESLSTFSSHLKNITTILDGATAQSLVLIDELGSGTDPRDGEVLGKIIIEELVNKNSVNIITTHFNKIKEMAMQNPLMEVGAVGFDLTKMQPTYKFIKHSIGESNAFKIARRYGLSEALVNKAVKEKEMSLSDEEHKLVEYEKLLKKVQNEEELLKKQSEELALKEKELHNQKIKLDKEKEIILKDAESKADALLQETQAKVQEVYQALKNQSQGMSLDEYNKLRQQIKNPKSEEVEVKNYEFKEHDMVKIKDLNYHGELISIKGKKGVVLCNGLKMNVKLSDLEPSDFKKPVVKQQTNLTKKKVTNRSATLECNIIGKTVSEGIEEVSKYIDDAIYHKQAYLRIIHGNGSGKLRQGIQNYLKRNKFVKSYRIGGENEGGTGATVVTLKTTKNG